MKHPLFIFLMLLTTVKLNGQVPQGFAFQTIIRDSEGKVLKNQTVGLQFSILEGGETGTSAYTERHTAISNAYGVINVTIGQGTLISGTYDEINWGGTLHYLKTDIDLDGGVNYSISKTAQLVSVPYSEYAKKASVADTVLKVPDTSSTNEIQELSVSTTGDTLYLSGGNYVIIPGLSYGNSPDVMDYDGNIYKTGVIGSQIWMVENLRTTRYNDGTQILNVTDNTVWTSLNTGARTYYNNDSTQYSKLYGALYNWYTVETGKLCPIGWHVPTETEWNILINYVGGQSLAGGRLKEASSFYWNSPNTGATDDVGFTALPGGFRYFYDGRFNLIREEGLWWTATSSNTNESRYLNLIHAYAYVSISKANKTFGFSIRCLKD